MATLPEPTVTVTPEMQTDTESGRRYIDVTIQRDDKGKTYRGTGATQGEVTADVVKQIITDPHSLEWQTPVKKP